jgi:adenylosuccinate lyase
MPLDQNGESDQPRCKSGGILIKDAFEKLGLSEYKEFIHFGLTSQDINNTAIPLSDKKARESVHAFFDYFDIKIERSKYRMEGRSMLARTHGQPALRVWGKKLVFERLEEQMRLLFNIPLQLNLWSNRKL